jgi:hypothetical protein
MRDHLKGFSALARTGIGDAASSPLVSEESRSQIAGAESERLSLSTNKKSGPTQGAAFSRSAIELADDHFRAMMAVLLGPAVMAATLPTEVAAVVTVLLDNDDSLCSFRGRAHNRQSKAESGDGSESKYDLTHASFSSEVNATSMRKGQTSFHFLF